MDLKPGEIICDKCNGEGIIEYPYNRYIRRDICNKCHGDRKLDWIENIVGKEIPPWDSIYDDVPF